MTQSHREQPSYSFPSKLDMLAQFGLEPEAEEEFFFSLTYRFGSRSDVEVLVTYSDHRHFVDVTMFVRGEEVVSLSTNNVAEMRIREHHGACWLQVLHEEGRELPDLFIHIEPKLTCRWA